MPDRFLDYACSSVFNWSCYSSASALWPKFWTTCSDYVSAQIAIAMRTLIHWGSGCIDWEQVEEWLTCDVLIFTIIRIAGKSRTVKIRGIQDLWAFVCVGGIAGAVVGETEVPGMITISAESRPRERKLATATVWCVSIANVSDDTLQSSLDWACGPLANQGQVNCGPIQVGGVCYEPNTVAHHCDWAFNAYFQKMNATDDACVFAGTAQKVYTDPSKTSTHLYSYSSTASIVTTSSVSRLHS